MVWRPFEAPPLAFVQRLIYNACMNLVHELRSKNINVRVTEAEHARLVAAAVEGRAPSVSDYVRRRALDEEPVVTVDEDRLGEVDRELDEVKQRLTRLESFASGSGGGW